MYEGYRVSGKCFPRSTQKISDISKNVWFSELGYLIDLVHTRSGFLFFTLISNVLVKVLAVLIIVIF